MDREDLFPQILNKAFQLAETGTPGPVLISVPMDIFSKEIEESLFDSGRAHTKSLAKPSIDDTQAEEIIQKMTKAEKPVFHVGGGIMLADAAAELRELAEHLSIPVSHSLMGKGAVSDESDLTLGMTGFWGTKFINDYTRTADWMLALGTRFAEADSSSWEDEYTFSIPDTKLIHIDIEPGEIGRNYPAEIGVVADLKQALGVLLRKAKQMHPEGLKNDDVRRRIMEYREDFAEKNQELVEDNSFPMMPQRILAEVRNVLPRDAYITTDVGWNKNGMGQQFPVYEAGTVLTPGGYATMGFGAPAALEQRLLRRIKWLSAW